MKLLAVFTVLCLALVAGADEPDLKKGDEAPDFELTGSDGETHKLSDFKGKQAIILAWYPKAFTGG